MASQQDWGVELLRTSSPEPDNCHDHDHSDSHGHGHTHPHLPRCAVPNSPLPHRRFTSISSSRSSKSARSSVGTASTLPEYSHDAGSHEFILDATAAEHKSGEHKCNCRGSCLSFIVPDKALDFGSTQAPPPFTTLLRPPPRPLSRISFSSDSIRAESPAPSSSPVPSSRPLSQEIPLYLVALSVSPIFAPEQAPAPVPDAKLVEPAPVDLEASHPAQAAQAAPEETFQDALESLSDSDSDAYTSATEDHSPRGRRAPKPPMLILRSIFPHAPPRAPCQCTDPLCPGGELDQAYDAQLPCDCEQPDCQGGEMALAWKLRADGLRKTGRVRHVNEHRIARHSDRKGTVWGYSMSMV